MPASRTTTKPTTKAAAKKAGSKKPGLYANIKAKHDRIAHGSGEQMRQPGEKGAPSSDAFEKSAKTSAKASNKKSPAKGATARKAPARRAG